uniref:NADH-ubiquinone oxidoreductase chain 6 n=1 Tax=Vietnamella dabieshanensis TaxID=756260 RepID=X1W3G1_9INSE|nr:NADH dehydrogenase subunit 6 [Vietnamella dabieshanensis]
MIFMLTTCLLTVSFTFIFMKHPLAMGLILLLQTILISIITGIFSGSFWFSYILFLVFLGGMLVLFIYMTSLASNEMFSVSAFMFLILPFSIPIFLVLYVLTFNTPAIQPFPLMYNFIFNIFKMQDLTLNLLKLYNSISAYLTILLVSYLLLTLIVVVIITNFDKAPLRSYN